ncbi:MAG: FliM/FliN family flagellar motor switch protein [Thermoguttaceae bacterium]|nr:FliM/FliN family flagellar motor switch protein [Thermoguttaceae bacterium]MBQ9800706.1 FliM/FliN family flagellar motor switch protein [Thermoguttaceae bacterium]
MQSFRFPNASRFAPIFTGRQAPPATPNASTSPTEAFFSEFESSFAEAARRRLAPTAEVLFDRFGFATLDDFARRFESSNDVPSENLLFADERGARYLLIAPTTTFRLLFDAALGFDVSALCANDALWNDFNADAQTRLTSFEKEAFAQEAECFAAFSPVALLSSPPTAVSLRPTSVRAALDLDDALFYWERRFVRLSDRLFPWTLVFSTRFLASTVADASVRESSEPSTKRSALTSTPPSDFLQAPPFDNRTTLKPTARFFPSVAPRRSAEPSISPQTISSESPETPSVPAFELAVVVERGEMSAESWRRLKPGDILTTDVPANALFLGLVDDAPRFLCRPGLFRGAAAVQIKTRADDARE